LGYAQILQLEEPTSALLQKGLQAIQTSGEHLLSIITDILDLARTEAFENDPQQNDFHLPLLLETLSKMMRIRAEEKNIIFSVRPFDFSQNRPAKNLPTALRGDEKRLRQTLINLLGNAIKFTNNGSVTLKVGLINKEEATANKDLSMFRFWVEDTGPGISADCIKKIFSPFQQESSEHAIKKNGLGLPISRKFVKIMGGQLQVKSVPGQGSVFWFDIPLLQLSRQKRTTADFFGEINTTDTTLHRYNNLATTP
jgi:signal transduction histidine kinase